MTEPRSDELPFEARLAAARKRAEGPATPREVAGSAFAKGTKLAVELVAGVLVGAAIGFWLDRLLDTSPIFLIGMFLLGLAAGFNNLMRAVRQENAKFTQADLEALPVVEDDDEDEKW
ncbi:MULTISPECIES: AtpZ/AtpI family protein [Pacificimonas]|uniref:AtpZ/AtpI family protein n=1 Tax=Pacificimonas aurantium TaxID=1250540 RepID=A0ABS7WLN5_9SPHN|nr:MULTISPECIES: AtpZ/AtpI family protein [Pacificimonas]MBZ6378472.1 AtpZ/AtpI family protein [Pacificimonas aurantium]